MKKLKEIIKAGLKDMGNDALRACLLYTSDAADEL